VSDVVTLENDDLRVEVAATEGGRVRRLLSRRDGREWFHPPRGFVGTPAGLTTSFVATDHFGWDEMLPTVDPSVYRGAPYDGVALADHGELWSAEWTVVDATDTSLTQRVVGRQIDFVLERTLRLDHTTLHATYRCEVPRPTDLLWALHPQFACVTGTRLELDGVTSWMVGEGAALSTQPWPGALIVERDLAPGEDRNCYLAPGHLVTHPRLIDPSGATVTVTWDHDFAPYLVVWADYQHYSPDRVIAIEPMSGYYDALDRAQAHDRISHFSPEAPTAWWVDVTVTPGGSQ
jgi:galactose mutarotase-like enzyme